MSGGESKDTTNSPIKELVSLLNNESKNDDKDDDDVSMKDETLTPPSTQLTSRRASKLQQVGESKVSVSHGRAWSPHRKEVWRLNRQRKKEELEELRANQCHGITILMTQPNGKILTNKLTSEADYIEFITSVFDTYKLQKQIIDYRILRGEQPDL